MLDHSVLLGCFGLRGKHPNKRRGIQYNGFTITGWPCAVGAPVAELHENNTVIVTCWLDTHDARLLEAQFEQDQLKSKAC